jgi:hypothetical protein
MRINLTAQNAFRKLASIKLYYIWISRNSDASERITTAMNDIIVQHSGEINVLKAWETARKKNYEKYRAIRPAIKYSNTL